jgi:YgiT-type zinc finger domain-containing protein
MPKDRSRDPKTAIAPCPECQTGVLYLQHITYFTWLNEELVTVQQFPAWVCDLCGRREYDMRAIKWLNALLHPEAGRNAPLRRIRAVGADPAQGTDQPQLQ